MKKTLLLTLTLALTVSASAQKYAGGDISMLPKYEDAGVVYKDKNVRFIVDERTLTVISAI